MKFLTPISLSFSIRQMYRSMNNDLCSFCAKEKETVEHVLYDCEIVTLLFTNVQSWFMSIFHLKLLLIKTKRFCWVVQTLK
jgi:hypothetical protein